MALESRRRHRAGDVVDDRCRVCGDVRRHTVLAADPLGTPLRVLCESCGSQHNYRRGIPARSTGRAPQDAPSTGGRDAMPLVSERERSFPPMSEDDREAGAASADLELLLRSVIREEAGITPAVPAEKWRDGHLVLRPGREGLQEKSWPIESFFHKIVMIRNRLRVLEQHVNSSDLPVDTKVKLQGYVTACYGSLTSFNILFAEEDDRFRGASGESK